MDTKHPRRLPSLNGLLTFEAVARHQSVTRAAEELSVTQTAVSHQIRRLEAELDLRLFVRRPRRMVLTEAAQEYLPAVRDAFDALRAATEDLARHREGGTLTISTVPSFANRWLVPRLAAFQQLHPGIDLRIAASVDLVDFARDGVDGAIRYGSGEWPGLDVHHLFTEELFPVCSPALLEGSPRLRTPRDLKHHTLLHVTSQVDSWQRWLEAAGVRGVEHRRGLYFEAGYLAIQAAVAGAGVAVGRTATVADDLAAGRLVAPFDVRTRRRAYYFVAPKTLAGAPKIVRFREWLLAQAREATDPAEDVESTQR